MFDIHSFDYLEMEFGVLSNNVNIAKDNSYEEPKQQLTAQHNKEFDFVEACQSLKEDILRPINAEGDEDSEVHHSDIPTLGTDDSSEGRSDDFVDVEKTESSVVDVEKTDSSVVKIDSEDVGDEKSGIKSVADTTLCIVTASREPFMWIWDLNVGAALEKVAFKMSQKASDIKFHGENLNKFLTR